MLFLVIIITGRGIGKEALVVPLSRTFGPNLNEVEIGVFELPFCQSVHPSICHFLLTSVPLKLLSHLILSHLIESQLISSYLIESQLISSYLIGSHLGSSCLIGSHLISSPLTSSHLIIQQS